MPGLVPMAAYIREPTMAIVVAIGLLVERAKEGAPNAFVRVSQYLWRYRHGMVDFMLSSS